MYTYLSVTILGIIDCKELSVESTCASNGLSVAGMPWTTPRLRSKSMSAQRSQILEAPSCLKI